MEISGVSVAYFSTEAHQVNRLGRTRARTHTWSNCSEHSTAVPSCKSKRPARVSVGQKVWSWKCIRRFLTCAVSATGWPSVLFHRVTTFETKGNKVECPWNNKKRLLLLFFIYQAIARRHNLQSQLNCLPHDISPKAQSTACCFPLWTATRKHKLPW